MTPGTVRIAFELTIQPDSSVSNLTVVESNLPDDPESPECRACDKIHSAVRNAIYQHNNSLPVR